MWVVMDSDKYPYITISTFKWRDLSGCEKSQNTNYVVMKI